MFFSLAILYSSPSLGSPTRLSKADTIEADLAEALDRGYGKIFIEHLLCARP